VLEATSYVSDVRKMHDIWRIASSIIKNSGRYYCFAWTACYRRGALRRAEACAFQFEASISLRDNSHPVIALLNSPAWQNPVPRIFAKRVGL
jgi:hypothetical protein